MVHKEKRGRIYHSEDDLSPFFAMNSGDCSYNMCF